MCERAEEAKPFQNHRGLHPIGANVLGRVLDLRVYHDLNFEAWRLLWSTTLPCP